MAPVKLERAANHEELMPLIEHCKAGRLFAVQDWIAEGKPILPPTNIERRKRKRSPLEWAVELGFHSLLEVFLKAGVANDSDNDFCLLCTVLGMKRLDRPRGFPGLFCHYARRIPRCPSQELRF